METVVRLAVKLMRVAYG